MKSEQWCEDGNPLNGIPSRILRLLAEGDKHFGYGYGDGWSMVFGSNNGPVVVEPGQWVTRYDDGRVTVTDERPVNGTH